MIIKKQLLLLVMFLLPMIALADKSGTCGDYLIWTLNESTGTLTIEGSGAMEDFSSPSSVPWYGDRTKISNVVIGGGVTKIGKLAFSGCSGLTSITIPNSVTNIGEKAFLSCYGLTSVTIPNSVTSIGEYAFHGCSGLTSVTIRNSVTSIGMGAFSECSKLYHVIIQVTDFAEFCSNTIVAHIRNVIYPSPIIHLIDTEGNEIQVYVIPDGVTSIGSYAFYGCSFNYVTIPNSVTSIGESAFYQCSLRSVVIPSSVTSISDGAFSDCSYLSLVTIRNGVTSIGDNAFSGCSRLTSVTIPNSVTSIGESAFKKCFGLTSITIPNSVTRIGDQAFYGCFGLSFSIPNSVTSIGKGAFYGCSGLTSITIPNSVTKIGDQAFCGVYIPTVISLIENPFTIQGKSSNDKVFSLNTFDNATLYVPQGTIEKYKATDGWKDFAFIEEGIPAGINAVENTKSNNTTIYDLNGVRQPEPKKGINIVNGRKVVVK